MFAKQIDQDDGSDEEDTFLQVGNEDAQQPSASDDEEDPQENSQYHQYRHFSGRSSGHTLASSSKTHRDHLSGRVLSDRANSVPLQRLQQIQDRMVSTRPKTQKKTAVARAQSGKKSPKPPSSSAPSKPLTDDDKTLKLQANELKILELQKQLAALQGNQGSGQENQGSGQNPTAEAQETVGASKANPSAAPKRKLKLGTESAFEIPLSGELEAHVIAITKQEIWRTVKFISNEEQLKLVCGQIMAYSEELSQYVADNLKKEVKEAYIASLAKNYGEKICGAINSLRTNVQSNIRKAYVERAMAGHPMPTPAQMLHVIKRKDLVMENDKPKEGQTQEEFVALSAEFQRNMDWFLWYWEKLLVQDAGKEWWSGAIRHYGTISSYAPLDEPKNKYITNSSEAMIVLIFENCAQRFPYIVECAKAKVKPDQNSDRFQAKWSNLQSGQNIFGGWEFEARSRFIDLKKSIRIAKSRPHVKEVEEIALKLLRKSLNLKEKKEAKRDKSGPDLAGKEKELEDFMEDPTEEVAIGEEENSDIEELDDVFLPPPKKKTKA